MKGYIYGLTDPITKIVVYVGATREYPTARYIQHYRHLDEVLRGKRNTTKKFEYMKKLLPLKLKFIIIEEVDILDLYIKEKEYINKYRLINKDLLNETDGGVGGNTYMYKTKKEISAIGEKLSQKLKGKKKPDGFAERLSANRKGIGNPGCKQFNKPVFCTDRAGTVIAEFNYGFEINDFVNSKHGWSNVKKFINSKTNSPYGYFWKV